MIKDLMPVCPLVKVFDFEEDIGGSLIIYPQERLSYLALSEHFSRSKRLKAFQEGIKLYNKMLSLMDANVLPQAKVNFVFLMDGSVFLYKDGEVSEYA